MGKNWEDGGKNLENLGKFQKILENFGFFQNFWILVFPSIARIFGIIILNYYMFFYMFLYYFYMYQKTLFLIGFSA